jgi:hypothetical protein
MKAAITRFFSGIAQFIRARATKLWIATVVILVAAVIILWVRPFGRTNDLATQDVSQVWSKSISRLGILPLYPPEEDFHVGDVWVVGANFDEEPLLKQGVRIGHIDLRPDIIAARHLEPVFADTTKVLADEAFRREPATESGRLDPKDDKIILSLAAFPAVTISYSSSVGTGIGADVASLGGSRGGTQTDEVTITTAETYGAPAATAFARLDAWCSAAATRIFCSDAYARTLLAYSANNQVLETKNNAYTHNLLLTLVTRVFLTREIKHNRRFSDVRGIVGNIAIDPNHPAASPAGNSAGEAGKPGVTSDAQSNSGGNDAVAAAQSAVPSTGGALAFGRSDGSDVQLNQVYQRPVVFGYRAIILSLPPGKPSEVGPP